MTQVRTATHVLSFQPEDAYNVENASFVADRLFLGTWDFDLSQLKKGEVENQVVRADLGENQPGIGLASDNGSLNFNTYPQGLGGGGAGDTVVPTKNAFTHLLESCLGAVAVLHTGSKVKGASTTTATAVFEDVPDAHAANGVLVIEDERTGRTGRVICRPYNTYATDEMTLLMGLPAAQVSAVVAGTTVIYGCAVVNLNETGSVSLQGDALGARTTQNANYYGAVFNMSIAEVGVGEAPVCAFEGKIGSFERAPVRTRTSVDSQRPLVLAGGEMLLAKFGNVTATELKNMRFAFTLGREYTREAAQNDDGIGGWVLTNQTTELTVYVDENSGVPTGFTGTDWFQIWEDTADSTSRLHFFVTLGQARPGLVAGIYLPKIHLKREPEHADMNGVNLLRLVFGITQGGNQIRFFQA
jgi:hypothetical protein